MKPSPAFQFYPDDFLAGVADMTQAEVGAYILLLCQQWNRGSIPVEPERQKNLAKGPVSRHVLGKFLKVNGGLKNKRLEDVRKEQDIYREKQRQNGLASGVARRERSLNGGSTIVEPTLQPNANQTRTNHPTKTNSPSPSPSPSIKTTKFHKASGKPSKGGFDQLQSELTSRMHQCLNGQWENDRQKWMGRIKRMTGKMERVVAEVELAIREKRVTTTPAQYAEEIWKEFK